MMAVAEAEGDDYEDAGDEWIVYTPYDKMQDVVKALESQGIEVKGSELTMSRPPSTQLPSASGWRSPSPSVPDNLEKVTEKVTGIFSRFSSLLHG